jgi:hypothetical protein
MRMVGRLFVMSALMVLSSFAMVARGVRMVFCRLLVVLGCFLRNRLFPVLGCALAKALSRQTGSGHSRYFLPVRLMSAYPLTAAEKQIFQNRRSGPTKDVADLFVARRQAFGRTCQD